jgi:hypothetical protein
MADTRRVLVTGRAPDLKDRFGSTAADRIGQHPARGRPQGIEKYTLS